MGRELGLEAFDHYTEWRNIWINTDAEVARTSTEAPTSTEAS
jgi:hypothetical protein